MNKLNFRENFAYYITYLKPYWFLIGILVLLSVVVEVAGILDKFIFKFFIDNVEALIIGDMLRTDFVSATIVLLAIFFVVIIIHATTTWFALYINNRIQGRVMTDVKRDFFTHVLNLSFDFHTTHNAGRLISRLTRGATAAEDITDSLAWSIFPLAIQFLLVTGSLLYVHWLLLVIVLVIILAYAAYSLFLERIQIPARLKNNEVEDAERSFVADSFTNVETVKYFGKEKAMQKKFAEKIQDTYTWFIIKWDYFNWFQAGQTFIVSIGTLLLIAASAWLYLEGAITLGDIVFAQSVFASFIAPLYRFTWYIRRIMQAFSDFESLMRYRRIKQTVIDKARARVLKVSRGTIDFDTISFTYHGEAFIHALNLKIRSGEKVAFVGHSGSGKSTMVKLLYRLYDVDKGTIRIDGQDISEIQQASLRDALSIVPQEGILFDDTLYNNISFVAPTAARKDVLKAIRAAQLDDVIARLPNKEQTIVGERGIRLSGGERQRVAIARGLLAHKRILILDEATSALDSQTEMRIQEALRELLKGKTAIIIAHRLSTIMNADRIIVFDRGTIVQQGTHDELIAQKGPYKKLWNLQKGGYIN